MLATVLLLRSLKKGDMFFAHSEHIVPSSIFLPPKIPVFPPHMSHVFLPNGMFPSSFLIIFTELVVFRIRHKTCLYYPRVRMSMTNLRTAEAYRIRHKTCLHYPRVRKNMANLRTAAVYRTLHRTCLHCPHGRMSMTSLPGLWRRERVMELVAAVAVA